MSRLAMTTSMLLVAGFATIAAVVVAAGGRPGDQEGGLPPVAAEGAEAGSLHVRVVDPEGKGVPGITIEVHRPMETPRSLAADADGRATIPRDVLGESGLLIAGRGRDSIAWCPRGDADARPNRPAGTEDRPIVMILLPLDHRAEGAVVNREGRPIPGVAMLALDLNHPTNGSVSLDERVLKGVIDPVFTDQAGRFVIRLPRQADVGLKPSHPRYIGQWIAASADARSLRPAVLEPAGGIAGRVIDAATGRPVPGAGIGAQLIETHRRIYGGWGETRSDGQGRFLIGGLEPGVHNVVLLGVPGRPAVTARAVEGVRVRAGADTPADLAVIEARRLRGVVVDRISGRPVPGIPVGCHGTARPRSGATVLMTRTDEQGRFTFGVPPGEQYLYLADGSEGQRLAHRDVMIPERGEVEPVRLMRWIKPVRNPAMEAMKVATPRPVEPAKAIAAAATKEVVAAGDDSTAGRAVVRAEPSNRASEAGIAGVRQEVKPPPLGVRTTTRTIYGNGDGDLPIKAPIPDTRTVVGHVCDSRGRPLAGIHLGIAGAAESVATDRDGVFELLEAPRGDLRIYLQRRHGKFQFETIPAGRDRVELTLRTELDDQPGPPRDEPIPPGLRDRLTFIDLGPSGTDYLSDGPGGNGNDLDRLPRGVHRLGETYFRVGEEMVHLQGRERPDLPRSVKGIAVRARGRVLHFLHSTQGGADMEDRIVGVYVIHYADGSAARAPIVYSRDITNWWHRDPGRRIDRARPAWTGGNDMTEQHSRPGLQVRLFDMAWTNPHPQKEIASLDVLSAGKECDPFLVAVTLVRDR